MVAEVYSHLQYDCMSEQQLSKIWLSQSVAPAAAHSELFGQVQQLVVWTNMGVPQNAGTPVKMDDFGVTQLWKPSYHIISIQSAALLWGWQSTQFLGLNPPHRSIRWS